MTDKLAGLTKQDCADACNKDGCAITGLPRCCSPNKGGLPIECLSDPQIMDDYDAACQKLGMTNAYRAGESA